MAGPERKKRFNRSTALGVVASLFSKPQQDFHLHFQLSLLNSIFVVMLVLGCSMGTTADFPPCLSLPLPLVHTCQYALPFPKTTLFANRLLCCGLIASDGPYWRLGPDLYKYSMPLSHRPWSTLVEACVSLSSFQESVPPTPRK